MTIQHIIAAVLRRVHLTYIMSDTAKIKLWYRLAFGKKLNLTSPQIYNDKLQWLKLYDRQPQYTMMVDKYAVKEWVKKTIGEKYVIPTIAYWNSPDEIEWNRLPERYVLKTTSGCGNSGVVVVKDGNAVAKDIKRQKAIMAKLRRSFKQDAYKMLAEWPYRDVPKRIIAEQYMEDQYGELRDYKFFCFNGEVKAMFIASGRASGQVCFDFYDRDFTYLNIEHGHPTTNGLPTKPQAWEEMVTMSEKLSAGIPHVRVDLYEINGHPYFGEMTFYHHGGYVPFKPNKWDKIFGDWITLPKK